MVGMEGAAMSAQLDKGGGQPRGLGSPASHDRPVSGLPDAPGGVPGLVGHSWQSLRSCHLLSTCYVPDGKWTVQEGVQQHHSTPLHSSGLRRVRF